MEDRKPGSFIKEKGKPLMPNLKDSAMAARKRLEAEQKAEAGKARKATTASSQDAKEVKKDA